MYLILQSLVCFSSLRFIFKCLFPQHTDLCQYLERHPDGLKGHNTKVNAFSMHVTDPVVLFMNEDKNSSRGVGTLEATHVF